jgi:hypothetical protein
MFVLEFSWQMTDRRGAAAKRPLVHVQSKQPPYSHASMWWKLLSGSIHGDWWWKLWCACMLGERQTRGRSCRNFLPSLALHMGCCIYYYSLEAAYSWPLSLCLPQEQRGLRQSRPGSQPLVVLGKPSWDGRPGQHGEHLVASYCYVLCSGVQRRGELGEASLRYKCRKL